MFSKFMTLLALLCLTGCGLHLFKKTEPPVELSYNGKGYTCVSQIPDYLSKYINDDLDNDGITQFIGCLQNSFKTFAQFTRGRSESVYESEELRRFLQDYFLKGRVISPEFMHQFMVIKQVMFGGDTDRLSRTELLQAIDLLEQVRTEAINIKPHLKYLNPSLLANQDRTDLGKHLNDANLALARSLDAFSAKLQNTSVAYSFDDFKNLIVEFRKFVSWDEHVEHPIPVEQWIGLFKDFKEITVSSSNPDVIKVEEWVPLFHAMGHWYSSFLEFKVGVAGQPIFRGVGLQNSIFLGQEIFDLLEQAINRQPEKTITFEQMHNLVQDLHNVNWIPERIRVSSVDKALRSIILRIFYEADDAGAGLTLRTIADMKSEFARWYYVQLDLETHYPASGKLPKIPEIAIPKLLAGEAPVSSAKSAPNLLQGSNWDGFVQAVSKLIRPLFPEDTDRLYTVPSVDEEAFNVRHGFYNLSVMNALRSITALAYRGYAKNYSPQWIWSSVMTSDELQRFYMDFRDLGIDLTVVDSRNNTAGSTGFLLAKLFTYTSQGYIYEDSGPEAQMSFPEAMTYFAYLYTGGKTADDVFNQLRVDCPTAYPGESVGAPLDPDGVPMVYRGCVYDHFPELIQKYMGNMPYLQRYLTQLDADSLRSYARTVIDTGKTNFSQKRWFEHSEMATIAVIMLYAETVMTEYGNQDGRLTNDGLNEAAKTFLGIIKKMAHDQKGIPDAFLGAPLLWGTVHFDVLARGIFVYILDQHEVPAGWGSLAAVKDEFWAPTVSLSRLDLAEVFKVIIQGLVNNKPPAPAPPK